MAAPTPPQQADLFGPPPPAKRPAHKQKSQAPRAGPQTLAGQTFTAAVQVAVATHTELLTYGLRPEDAERLQLGARVTVPLRGQLATGVAWRKLTMAQLDIAPERLRPLVAVREDLPPLAPDLLASVEFVANYYHCPLGAAVKLALPAMARHTGIEGDDAPSLLAWWVASTDVRPWPADLSRQEGRILQRVEAEGSLAVADLRRGLHVERALTPPDETAPQQPRAVKAPQAVLEALAERGLVRLWQERILRDPMGMREPVPPDVPRALTPEQRLALHRLLPDLQAGHFAGHLLRGITGSGKTEVYLQLIAQALDLGRSALVLVPEIALTPELVRRFRARFGDQVAALHSGMGDGERYDQYTQIALGQRRIVVGPRSARFAPVRDLGVLVVDECHDASFKQNAGIRYHARDVALFRARSAGAVCLLGSATPGCEEMHLAQTGKLHLTEMEQRPLGGTLPATHVVDLRAAPRVLDLVTQKPSVLSVELCEAVRETVARGEQALILHNRRGFASALLCQGCGEAVECPDCAISLTLHQGQRRLRCHYCDFSVPADVSCAHCHGHHMVGIGAGTERIEDLLAHEIPGLRVRRFDRDTAVGQRLLDTLDRFARRELDVLVGTQMLAKGHDFPAVTLVGVVLAETGLRVPDFRAAERTFQLLTQVAGRAGRGEKPGRVLVQTYAPEHPAIDAALRHDHKGFIAGELRQRALTGYPPSSHLALLETRHEDAERAHAALQLVVDALRGWGAEVRGPVAAGLARLRGISRAHALLRSQDRKALHGWLRRALQGPGRQLPAGVELVVDVDPYAMS